jgi:protein-L-isoaspartate(D-aspartate) O-methyltransferase
MGEGESLATAWHQLLDRLEEGGRYSDLRLRRAFLQHPRWEFLPETLEGNRRAAVHDKPVAIGDNQTISAPHMVAILLDRADPQPGDRCLEVGAGSGWLAVLAGVLVGVEGHVVGVEIVPELVELARDNVREAGADNVEIVMGDGGIGCPEQAPYDRIIVSAAAPEVPEPLLRQLATPGTLVIPVGPRAHQQLVRVRKTSEGTEREQLGGCAFVPLVGEHGF